MEATCARAVSIGLPSLAFTEHLDHTVWTALPERLAELPEEHPVVAHADDDGVVTPPALDAAGYLEAIERCRDRFPELRILSGLELGEPHRHGAAIADVLGSGTFDRLLGSLHCIADGDTFTEPDHLYQRRDPDEVVRSYLVEVADMVERTDSFAVLAHIDYPLRALSLTSPCDPAPFEDEFRHALRALALSGRALEINTRIPLQPAILGWWRDEGGESVTFGSDAHQPAALARGFAEAAAMAEAHGFRPSADPHGFWARA